MSSLPSACTSPSKCNKNGDKTNGKASEGPSKDGCQSKCLHEEETCEEVIILVSRKDLCEKNEEQSKETPQLSPPAPPPPPVPDCKCKLLEDNCALIRKFLNQCSKDTITPETIKYRQIYVEQCREIDQFVPECLIEQSAAQKLLAGCRNKLRHITEDVPPKPEPGQCVNCKCLEQTQKCVSLQDTFYSCGKDKEIQKEYLEKCKSSERKDSIQDQIEPARRKTPTSCSHATKEVNDTNIKEKDALLEFIFSIKKWFLP